MSLEPCPRCRRHVASTDRTCPFCAATLAAPAPRTQVVGRLTRAAIFAGATACWTSSPPPSNPGDNQFAKPPQGTATITGVATDGATGQPMAGVVVRCHPQQGEPLTARTDANGSYHFDVPPGTYSITFEGPRRNPRMAPQAQTVDVVAGQIERVNGTITAYDPSNTPMPYGAPPQRRRLV